MVLPTLFSYYAYNLEMLNAKNNIGNAYFVLLLSISGKTGTCTYRKGGGGRFHLPPPVIIGSTYSVTCQDSARHTHNRFKLEAFLPDKKDMIFFYFPANGVVHFGRTDANRCYTLHRT